MRLIIISNRAPINIVKDERGGLQYTMSAGGLATGLRTYVDRLRADQPDTEIVWMGWPGTSVDNEEETRKEIFEKFQAHSVFISDETMGKFYEGFCNKTIWPLFHYFPSYVQYDRESWDVYNEVNEIYLKALLEVYRDGDVIWIHDYHLMLLPSMIREKIPNATIGFFLHIPFPSYEIFRLLPKEWRYKLLRGVYGSDLIGFHTHDYRTYFLRSTLSILGLGNNMGEVTYNNRIVKVDSFPMGIDFDKFDAATREKGVLKEITTIRENFKDKKLILSIDRQDYSKGILNRLRGYEKFLENNPGLRASTTMIMVVIPSRVGVDDYMEIKGNIDALIGSLNGKYGTLNSFPILYQYRSLSYEELIALYHICDIALVTPLRDGMNLVAKEFIACKTDGKGVLILSEMAGAAEELSEAIIINPNNIEEIGKGLEDALSMPLSQQKDALAIMRNRLQAFDIFKWAGSFIDTLLRQKEKQNRFEERHLPDTMRLKMIQHYKRSTERILLLDYDGTLQPFADSPEKARPSPELLKILQALLHQPLTQVIIISGRDWQSLDKWFGYLPINLVAEHGLFIKEINRSWRIIKPVRRGWKKMVKSIMMIFAERLPGSFVEEKDYSLAFHYRKSDPSLSGLRVRELLSQLVSFTANMDLHIVRGNKVIEMRSAGIDKGIAALHWISRANDPSRFIIAIGDDETDEDMFRIMPKDSYSIRVGKGPSYAMYNLSNNEEVLALLSELSQL